MYRKMTEASMFVVALGLAGCAARSDTRPSPQSYAIEVRNTAEHPLNLSYRYRAGASPLSLGVVPGRESRVLPIADFGARAIVLIAEVDGRTETRNVRLSDGDTVRLVLPSHRATDLLGPGF